MCTTLTHRLNLKKMTRCHIFQNVISTTPLCSSRRTGNRVVLVKSYFVLQVRQAASEEKFDFNGGDRPFSVPFSLFSLALQSTLGAFRYSLCDVLDQRPVSQAKVARFFQENARLFRCLCGYSSSKREASCNIRLVPFKSVNSSLCGFSTTTLPFY